MTEPPAAIDRPVDIGPLQLGGGETLPAVVQQVTLYGTPAADGSNVAFVPHALTGSSRVADWWPAIAGSSGLLQRAGWCVTGINALGSCYGSTGARDGDFPRIRVADMVAAQIRALEAIGIPRIGLAIGGSLGGMQALQWAIDYPERVGHAIAIGAHDHHTALGIAFNALQREAIALDPRGGLRLARKIAMLTYKSEALLRQRHDTRPDRHGAPRYDVEGYLELQADRLERRMNPYAYATLTHAMDSFDVRGVSAPDSDGSPSASDVRKPAKADGHSPARRPRLTLVGISSDWLFRPEDVRAATERFRARGYDAEYLELHGDHGHDAFLAEAPKLATLLKPLL